MKIFLSSTYEDLIEHRAKVAEALERLGLHGVRMEVFGARPGEAAATCLDEIDSCDAFVGVYAHRYGYIPDNCETSITEQEFDFAKERQKPTFCFVLDDDCPWLPAKIEPEPGRSKLNLFKQVKIAKAVIFDRFTTPDDLALKVATSLARFKFAEKVSETKTTHYDWIITYSKSMAADWLALQTVENQETINKYLRLSDTKIDLTCDSKILDLLAEYLGYQLANGCVLQGALVCENTGTVFTGLAYLTFDPKGEPILAQINGDDRGEGRLELRFRQQPRTTFIGDGMVGRIKAFNYAILFHRERSGSLLYKGSLYHPDYDGLEIAKTMLVPRVVELNRA